MSSQREQPTIIHVTTEHLSDRSVRPRLWTPPYEWENGLGGNFNNDLKDIQRAAASRSSGNLAFELVALEQGKELIASNVRTPASLAAVVGTTIARGETYGDPIASLHERSAVYEIGSSEQIHPLVTMDNRRIAVESLEGYQRNRQNVLVALVAKE